MQNRRFFYIIILSVLTLICLVFPALAAKQNRKGWEEKHVNWRAGGNRRIKAVRYPSQKPPRIRTRQNKQKSKIRKKIITAEAASRILPETQQVTGPMFANIIDSPPINGFMPWIAISITDERFDEYDFIFDAAAQNSIAGSPLTGSLQSNYAIGIFDTGAAVHVMGYADAVRAGIYSAGLLTPNEIEIAGVISSVNVSVSQPLGVFIDGLGAINPNTLNLDTSEMYGESNVSIAVGQGDSNDLFTVIGPPLSVLFTTVIDNQQQITITRDSNEFTAPDIHIYDHDDPCVPDYSNIVPLELRPLGSTSVAYYPDPNYLLLLENVPLIPSTISTAGSPIQSLFFVHSVDLYETDKSAIDKDRFMFDTGAQLTVIGLRVGARLGLDPDEAEFTVDVQDVTGASLEVPGFYIDKIEIPALGEWLSFTDVPVILLDVASPEGGTLDGIIGMNLFVDFNLVLHGGGLLGEDDPKLTFQCIIPGDIAPGEGDGIVDYLDLAEFADHWLQTSASPGWNPDCDLAPVPDGDDKADFLDFAVLAENWTQGILN